MSTRTILLFLGAALLLACGSNGSSNGAGGHGNGGATGSGGTVGSGGTTGTGGTTGAGGACAIDPKFSEVLAKPLSSCSGHEPPCHNFSAGNLNIDPADATASWDALVNVAASISPSAGMRVVPGDPAHSFLYRKLINDLTPDEGAPMPKSGLATGWNELPADQIEMVRCWIQQGAKND
jgi:hypothetical protein